MDQPEDGVESRAKKEQQTGGVVVTARARRGAYEMTW